MRGSTCSACDKKREYMFEVGTQGTGVFACLYCVKAADCTLSCSSCKGITGYTDGHTNEDVMVLCTGCVKPELCNLNCHKCGGSMGRLIMHGGPWRCFCVSCLNKLGE